jgi:hypothetical protein
VISKGIKSPKDIMDVGTRTSLFTLTMQQKSLLVQAATVYYYKHGCKVPSSLLMSLGPYDFFIYVNEMAAVKGNISRMSLKFRQSLTIIQTIPKS